MRGRTNNLKERERQSLRFWVEFCDYLRQRGSQLRSLEHRTSDYKHYRDFRIDDIPGVAVRARQQVRRGRRDGRGLSAAFILDGGNQTVEFQLLREQQAEIENDFGESLSWYADGETDKQVNTMNWCVDVTNEADWGNQHEWLATKLEKLVKVFRQRILKFRAAEPMGASPSGRARF